MNPFLIRMLQKSRRNEPRRPGARPSGLGRAYAAALALIVLLTAAAVVMELLRTPGGP